MTTHSYPFWRAVALIVVAVFGLTACETINETEEAQLSEEEATVLTSVVADGLALETDGLMAGVFEATAEVTPQGLHYRVGANEGGWGHGMGGAQRHIPWRGDHDFSAIYDPETGEHTIVFERTVDSPNMEKAVSTELTYIFRDVAGTFLEYPRQDAAQVASVEFDGLRTGSMTIEHTHGQRQGTHASEFVHTANWFLEGVNTSVMTLEGSQERTGSALIVTRRNGTLERTFSMAMNLVDVSIAVETTEDDTLYVVSGVLEYAVTVTINKDGDTTTREYSGTIELTEDGYALMRVMGLRHLYRIDLYDGDVVEQ